ncbi:MAG: type VI secretion system membrane subunit TssM [Vicinamibacterales bacterium]
MLRRLWRISPVMLGLVLLSLFVWFAGPYFAFADYRPLESVTARLVLIVLILLTATALYAIKRLRAARASDQLAAAVVEQAVSQPAPNAELVQLRERFEEAVAQLKQTRKSGQSLYELPWYVIIGAPGSGKTTALVNSGLHFPLEQRSGRGALRGIGGTRNCDWWFTDEAVLLDTAGRYTTQDSDAAGDSQAWDEFLALLKKYRKRRPLNGVILTVSAQDLMGADDTLERHTAAARARLNELNRQLKIQLPIYLLVTKCDLLAGFSEYFDDLTQGDRQQVWGVTFPFDQTAKGEAAQQFEPEFNRLVVRLNERVFARLEEDRDPRRRTLIFGLPQQLAALKSQLGEYIAGVFRSTRFDEQVLLRGVYLTSGTQEGTPIDRLLGAFGRRLGSAAPAIAAGGRGKAYFIERLLKDVIFAESGLAGINRRIEMQMAAAQVVAYVAMALLTITAIVLWTVSYSRNRGYLDQVEASIAPLAATRAIQAQSLDEALPRLDALRAVVTEADRYRPDVPVPMRWGLYQGSAMGDAARDAYSRELDDVLLPQVAARFRQRLVDYATEPEKLYEYLKGYLMLGDPTHLDRQQLGYLADFEWQEAYASDPARAQQVSDHFKSLLEYRENLRAIDIDQEIVTQARNTLRQASLADLVYRYVRIGYANDTARQLRLDRLLGIGAEKVFARSGAALSDPISSIYTKPVFEEIVAKGTDQLVLQFVSEYWVWGDQRPSVTASSRITTEFIDLYEKDYIAAWDRVLAQMQFVPLRGLTETKDVLAILGSPASPLRALLKTVDDHTYLVRPAATPQPGVLGSLGNRVGGVLTRGRERLGITTAVAGMQVTNHFAQIHQLLSGDAGSAAIDGVLRRIQDLNQRVLPLGTGAGEQDPARNPTAVQAAGQSANELQREAAQLPSSLGAAVSGIAGRVVGILRGTVGGGLDERYGQQVLAECRPLVGNRYPFVAAAAADVPLADFGRLFGYGGLYDSFLSTELTDLVDTGRATWAWKAGPDGRPLGGSAGMLRRIQAARRVRDAFFRPGSMEPELRFTLTPDQLDASAVRFTLDVDGQSMDYRHAAPRPMAMTWPGPNPGQVVVTFEERGGARPNLVFSGPWAWLKFLEASRIERLNDARFAVTTSAGGHQAQLILDAPSIRNPYGSRDLQDFRCE